MGVALSWYEYTETWVDALRLTTVQEGKQRTNDINANGDGPTWIQTATGRDKLRTAGGTPTTDSLTNLRATELARAAGET